MARFIQPQQQQIIPMYTPKNIDFYSGVLNKAQSDLERGTAMKAAAIEKLYDIPFSSKEDSDAVVGRAQEILKGTIDADFVSPSKVAQAVMQANAEVMPGVQAAKAKAKAAEMYENIKLKYGPNAWMGTDPTTKSIIDPRTGKYADPSQFKATGIDASEVDKAFLASQLSTLTRPGELTYSKQGAPVGMLKTTQTTGLSDSERDAIYLPGSPKALAIAQEQLKSMPQLLEVFGGNSDKALQQIMARNYQTSGAYKQDIQSRFIGDPAWAEAKADARARAAAESGGDLPDLTSFLPYQREASKTSPWVIDPEYSFTKDLTGASKAPVWRGGAFAKYNDIDKNISEMQARYNVALKLLKSGKGSVQELADATNELTRSSAEMRRLKKTKDNLLQAKDAYILNKAAELGYNVDNVKELPKEVRASFDEEIPKDINSLATFLDSKKNSLVNTTDFYNPLSIEANKAINNIFNPSNPSLYKDKGFRVANEGGDILPLEQVADKFNIEPLALSTQLNTRQINYNRGTGEFFTDIYTSGKVKDNKFIPDEDSKQERVYFRLDAPTANYTNLLTTARKLNNNKSTKKEVIFRSDKLSVEYAGNGVFNVAMVNTTNNKVVTIPSVNLGTLQDMIGTIIDSHVTKKYTIPAMSLAEQKYFNN